MSSVVAVLGGGAFGTALAKVLSEAGHPVKMWMRREAWVHAINTEHRHPARLKGVRLPPGLKATTSLEEAMTGAEIVVSAVPTVAVRPVWEQAQAFLADGAVIVSAAKGIETETLMLVSDIFKDVLPESRHRNLAYLSGPSFALEAARRQPTAVTIASEREETALVVQRAISTDYFRAYVTTDVVGVEVGGALKNVIAIAAGAADGLGLGLNAAAALVTRGLAEITRLGMQMGAEPRTLSGLSGMGDLVLTCMGGLSRNRTVGFHLGQGKNLEQILEELGEVAEGVNTAKAVRALAEREGVELPIAEAVHRLLFEGATARDTVFELMGRKLKHEQA